MYDSLTRHASPLHPFQLKERVVKNSRKVFAVGGGSEIFILVVRGNFVEAWRVM